jgi:hypothetical protein
LLVGQPHPTGKINKRGTEDEMKIDRAELGSVVIALTEPEIRELMDACCIALGLPFAGKKKSTKKPKG